MMVIFKLEDCFLLFCFDVIVKVFEEKEVKKIGKYICVLFIVLCFY